MAGDMNWPYWGFIQNLYYHGAKKKIQYLWLIDWLIPHRKGALAADSHWKETWSFRKFASNYLVSSSNLSIEQSV